jgi:predicted dehydrogenase
MSLALATGLPVVHRVEDIDADAAIVAVHPSTAPWVAQVLLRVGLHVMIEKPAALSVSDAMALESTAREGDRIVLVAHQHLFANGYERLVSALSGDAERVTAVWQGNITRPDYSALWDYGSHAVAALLGLGKVTVGDAGSSEDLYCADVRVGGLDGFVCVSSTAPAKMARLEVSGRGKTLVYDGYVAQEPPLTRAVRAFANAVRVGGTVDYRFGASWAVRVARVLEGIEAAARPRPMSA